MSEATNPKLPFAAKCPACGRRWVQTYHWPWNEALKCECGGFAEEDAMTEHAEKPHSLDQHINEPMSGKGMNDGGLTRDQELEMQRGREKDAEDAAQAEEE